MANERFDAVVIGAGHNGLVAALLLARAGWKVGVFEEKPVVGGACRTEYPFARAPRLGSSTGAYLLGVMPPELIAELNLPIKLLRRDPHYFLPTAGDRYLLLGADEAAARASVLAFFSEDDWRATQAMQAELAALRDDVAPAWLDDPLPLEATAERYVRPALRGAFLDLCRRPVSDYLGRFGFRSELLMAMYATTDGFTGADGGWDSPGTGLNFLVHNMCRLPGSGGTWMVVEGGTGAVTRALADAVRAAGGSIATGAKVDAVRVEGGLARGVALAGGREIDARAVLVNADPFRLRDLVGRDRLPADYNARLDNYLSDGRSLKVNLALDRLPAFRCLPEDRGQFRTTIHLLPDHHAPVAALRRAYDDARAGRLPDAPTIEWYTHTAVDPTLRDPEGRHSAALFVQWMPYQLAGSSWDAELDRYVRHLLSICDQFAPGTSARVVDAFALPPPAIEAHFGITRGHIFHVDNRFGFADRLPYRTPVAGLYAAGAGTHPAGSVIGCAGHNAARAVLRDAGVAPPRA